MPKEKLAERIKKGLLLLDGAMGTEIIAGGIEPSKCSEYLNIERPDVVHKIHKSYIDAGSDVVITNTFGASKYALARHGLEKNLFEINKAAAQIARRAAGEEKYVLGDIGPTGDFLEPFGPLKPEALRSEFARQVEGLLSGGVDGFIIETMSALDEATLAVKAAKSAGDLPVFACLAFEKSGKDFKTMMGVDVSRALLQILSMKVDAIGFNCGKLSLEDYVRLTEKYFAVLESFGQALPIIAEPNAGLPELKGNKAEYSVSADDFAAAAKRIYDAGARIIGGCCGTTPAHIKAIAIACGKVMA